MKNNRNSFILTIIFILVAAISRIISHEMQWFNLAPIAAVGLFAGAVLSDKKYAFLFAILAQLLGDVYLELFTSWPGFYGIDQAFVYLALIAVTILGFGMKQQKALSILGFSVSAAVLFFVVSNFGVWVAIQTGKADVFGYGTGVAGLINTYIAAIPFFKNTLISTVAGSAILFGAYHLLQNGMATKFQKSNA
ncbi:MAG TPA: hypothetical protein PLQ78_01480 [Flavipsychrobacter sp.]|jgi:hypothetical protein|nr:hypothetical protein [Flavipsychrobacter sp.]